MTIGRYKKATVQEIDIFLPSQNKRVVHSLFSLAPRGSEDERPWE